MSLLPASDPPKKTSTAYIQREVEKGAFKRLSRDELTDDAAQQYDAIAQKLGRKPEIILHTSLLPDVTQEFQAKVTEKNDIVLFVSEESHRMTVEAARNQLATDAQIKGLLDSGIYKDARKGGLSARTYHQYEGITREAGVDPEKTPIFLDSSGTLEQVPGPSICAMITQEGKRFILVNQSAIQDLPPKQFLATIRHEFDHLKHKDVSAEAVAEAHNNRSFARAVESRGDIESSVASCHPDAMAKALHTIRHVQMSYSDLSKADFKKEDKKREATDMHPSDAQRTHDLHELAARLRQTVGGGCEVTDPAFVQHFVDAATLPAGNTGKGIK